MWIQTYTGKAFRPLRPHPGDLEIADVAHALGNICRFNGHCREFYSVAEHSVRVAALLPGPLKLWGLLHDAAEAYIGDIVSPLKSRVEIWREPGFGRAHIRDVESEILECVARRFGLEWPMPAEVHRADMTMLATELRDLMEPPPEPWGKLPAPLGERILATLAPADARRRFLEAFARPILRPPGP